MDRYVITKLDEQVNGFKYSVRYWLKGDNSVYYYCGNGRYTKTLIGAIMWILKDKIRRKIKDNGKK